MSLTRWNFTSGSSGNTITATNTGASGVVLSGGTGTLSNAQSMVTSGLSALLTSTSTSGAVYFQKTGMSTTALSFDLYVYVTAAPSAAVAIAWAGTGSREVSLELNTNRTLTFKNSAYTSVWTSTYAIPLNTWVRVAAYFTQAASTGTARIALFLGNSPTAQDDSTLLTGQATGASAYTDLRLGAKCSTGTQTQTLYVGSWSYDPAATGLPNPYGMPVVGVSSNKATLYPGETATITATATDPDGTIASSSMSTDHGTLSGSGLTRTLLAPASLTDQTATITFSATDNLGNTSTSSTTVTLKASAWKLCNGGSGIPLAETLL